MIIAKKCEIDSMRISVLPYDNISNCGDLGVCGGRVLHLASGKMGMAAYQAEIALQAEVTRR